MNSVHTLIYNVEELVTYVPANPAAVLGQRVPVIHICGYQSLMLVVPFYY